MIKKCYNPKRLEILHKSHDTFLGILKKKNLFKSQVLELATPAY